MSVTFNLINAPGTANSFNTVKDFLETLSFLVRCLGILLQKVHARAYVRAKIDLMYKQANITIPTNRLGLAKAMGLVINLKLGCWFS